MPFIIDQFNSDIDDINDIKKVENYLNKYENRKNFFIAEIGINHNGDIEIAKKLIDAACNSGFDAVKFQKET